MANTHPLSFRPRHPGTARKVCGRASAGLTAAVGQALTYGADGLEVVAAGTPATAAGICGKPINNAALGDPVFMWALDNEFLATLDEPRGALKPGANADLAVAGANHQVHWSPALVNNNLRISDNRVDPDDDETVAGSTVAVFFTNAANELRP